MKKIDYHTVFEEEEYYHIYNRGNNKENIFCIDDNYNYFLKQWDKYFSNYLDILAFCLMPNHFHFFVKVRKLERFSKPQNYSKLWPPKDPNRFLEDQFKSFFTSYTFALNKQQKRTGSLFQKRFKRIHVDSNEYIKTLIHYIHHNPIHHNYVRNYGDWKYSSYNAIISKKSTKLNREDILEGFNGREEFIDFHKEMINYNIAKDILMDWEESQFDESRFTKPQRFSKPKILVLCTGNSCRSQMVEGFLKNIGKDRIEVFSAGIETHGVNPRAIKVMGEAAIDISDQTSNHIDEYKEINFDYLITACDHANEKCPFIYSTVKKLHHNFPDPAIKRGNEREVLEEYRNVRDKIKRYCEDFVKYELNSGASSS